jgi:hypothetical protein
MILVRVRAARNTSSAAVSKSSLVNLANETKTELEQNRTKIPAGRSFGPLAD